MLKSGIVRLTGKTTWRFWIEFKDRGQVALSAEYPNRTWALKALRKYLNQ